VVENREASADGSVRTLLLSVEDHVNFLEGRKVRHVQENRRWIDDYRVPGQFVAARYCADGTSTEGCAAGSLRVAQRLLCLASSPYEARRDSAMLDASLVELLVSRNGDADERLLAEMGPGAMIDVSRVAGDGFASLFNPKDINLMACLEGGHPLLVVAAGVRGIAPVRAALSWTPVLAHAGSCRVVRSGALPGWSRQGTSQSCRLLRASGPAAWRAATTQLDALPPLLLAPTVARLTASVLTPPFSTAPHPVPSHPIPARRSSF
jgi:hypothetical protein